MKYYLENLFFLSTTFVLSPLFYFFAFLNRRRLEKEPPKKEKELNILVIQTTKIGDVVCTTPVFREIKKKFPSARLSVLIIPRVKEILELNPYIDELIILNNERFRGFFGALKLIKFVAKKKFNWSVNFTPTLFNSILPFWAGIPNRAQLRSRLVSFSAYLCSFFSNYKYEYRQDKLVLRQYLEILKFLGINNFTEEKDVFINKESILKAKKFLKENGIGENDFTIGISLSAGNKVKEWSPKRFGILSDMLARDIHVKIIFLGSPSDRELVDKALKEMKNKPVISLGIFSLKEVPALIKTLKMFISVDSGPLYIAHALGVPLVDIIGPFNVKEQLPVDEKCEIVSKKIHCFPCSHIIPTAHGCKEGHRGCVNDIMPHDVYEAAVRLKKRIYN